MLQIQALNILKMGHNAFLTGAAGSGKTHTLRAYIKYLHESNIEVAITASTGIAATHLGGVTIHSWSGMGIKDRITDYDLETMEEKPHLYKRYQDTKVLIIDEISMLHHFRFDMLDRVARRMKRNELPFGGMQVILCGDFFQLPPVSRQGEQPAYFAYQSKIWKNMDLKICYLSEQHRQNDDRYTNMLNDIRANEVNDDTLQCLRDRYKRKIELDVEPTRLSTHNEDVDTINIKELEKIKGEEQLFLMDTKGKSSLVETLKKSCLAPEELRLKVGARVMFVKNSPDKGYVNGTLGTLELFNDEGDPVIRVRNGRMITVFRDSWLVEEDGKMKAELKQYPLRLAWAITIHKSQGMSLDAAEIDLSRSFAPGMGYVALSRVKSLEGLRLMGFNAQALQIHPEVLELDRELKEKSNDAIDELMEIESGISHKTVEDIQGEFSLKNASSKPNKKLKSSLSKNKDGSDIDPLDHNEEDFIEDMAESMRKSMRHSTQHETKVLLQEKKSIEEIAATRNLKAETIIEHIEFLLENGIIDKERIDIAYIKSNAFKGPKGNQKLAKIKEAFIFTIESGKTRPAEGDMSSETSKLKGPSLFRLAPVKNKLGNSFSYLDIRLARLFIYPELEELL